MKTCKKCGTELNEEKFCPTCGEPVEAQPQAEKQAEQKPQTQPEQPPQAQPQKQGQNDFMSKVMALNNTADTSGSYDKKDKEDNMVMAILAYFSWLVLIPLFAAKDSKFARYHCNQGLILAILETAFWIVEVILSAILLAISSVFLIITTIIGLVNLVFILYVVIGVMNVVNGKAKELPIIGKYRILK